VVVVEPDDPQPPGPDGDFSLADAYEAIDRAFAAGWNDPRMDDYDRDPDVTR